MSDGDRGQVDTSAAEVYDSLFVPALFGRFADAVAAAAGINPADHVVDVACGTGALTRAARTRTDGRVIGIDLNPAMLAVARRHGADIEYAEGDGQDLPFGDGEFDVAICQFGVMFYPDPARGLAELARVGRRGAVAVWDERLAGLIEVARHRLGAFATADDCVFGMTAKVATWTHDEISVELPK